MDNLAIVAAVVTVLYAASALGRLVPVKRRHHNWTHTSRMGVASVLVLALGGCAFVGASRMKPLPLPWYPADTAAVSNSLPIGVFAPGEWNTWSPVDRFDQQAGQPVKYVLDYMGQDQPFPGNLGKLAAEHGAEPVLQMEPTMALSAIAAGRDDSYLRHLSQQVGSYGHRLILSFAPEANGNWYSYGWTNSPAADYQAAWKHVMHEVTAQNVTWMDTLNVSYDGSGPLADYIVPGIMVGVDGYLGRPDQTFASALQPTISQVRKLTSAPVMLSETSADQAYQPRQIPGLVQGARQDHLAGLIWFDQDQQGGLYHQHWSLTQAGAAGLKASLRPSSVPVLLYHGINGTDDPDSDNVTLAEFRRQMAYLHSGGYQTISPQRYQEWAAGQPVDLPAKPVLLTADCNQASLLKVLPVLREYHYRLVMYVVTGFADSGYNGPEGQPGSSYYLGWDQLKALDADGYIYPQFHAGPCGHGYTMASSPYGCGDGPTPTPDVIWGHRYYSDPMGQTAAAYHARVEKDVNEGMAEMRSKLGLTKAQLTETFAVPFSDYGQPGTSDQPWLGSYLASRYSVVFVQSVNSPANGTIGAGHRFPRFEVDKPATMQQFINALGSRQFTD